MEQQDESKLINDILIWYWNNKDQITQNKEFWIKNKVGKELSGIIKECGRWKHAPRGNPKKGLELMKIKMKRNNRRMY